MPRKDRRMCGVDVNGTGAEQKDEQDSCGSDCVRSFVIPGVCPKKTAIWFTNGPFSPPSLHKESTQE
jgi:hypothetical protein